MEPSIRLFGRPEATTTEPGKFPAKGFALLALLVTSPDHRISRSHAAGLLWHEKKDGEALTNLRQLLARLRRLSSLTGELVVADSVDIRLGKAIDSIDLCRFLALGQKDFDADPVDVLLLYRDDLLIGLDEPTSAFTEWLLAERTRQRNRFFKAFDSVVVEATRYGRASADALDRIANHVIALEPEREASYRSLIEAFGRNGMFDQARQLYSDLLRMLSSTYGSEPEPATQAIARRVFSVAEDFASMPAGAAERSEQSLLRSQPRVAILSVSDPAGVADQGIINALFEDIANGLSRYRTFAVLAPHSAQAVPHASGLPYDNHLLRADYTVSGFVKPGGEVSLAVRMTNCRTGDIVWAAEYPAGKVELVRTFRVLSAQIAASLAAELERQMVATSNAKSDGQAYWHYLQGQNLMKDCTLPILRRARKAFRQAQKLDPEFALPGGRIAQTYYLEWLLRGGDEPELLLRARQHARQATDLDPGAAIGFWINAVVDLYQRNYDEAAELFAEAEALSPNSADLLVEHADAIAHLGDADAGWDKFSRALELNPIPPDHYWWAGASIAFCQEHYDKAVELCGHMKNTEPAVRLLAASHALLGQVSEARAYGRRIKEIYPSQPAGEISKVAPTRVKKVGDQFTKGLRIAGV